MADSLAHSKPIVSKPEVLTNKVTDSASLVLLNDSLFHFEDSLTESEESNQAIRFINLYNGHSLEVVHEKPVPVTKHTPDWVFPVLLAALTVFTFLKVYYSRYFNRLFSAFVSSNLTNQMVRDENILVQRASILLNLTFNITGALLLYFISVWQQWDILGLDFGFGRFIFFILLVAAVYTLKLLILKSCGIIFGIDREMVSYIFNIFLVNNVLGIVLLPLVALIAFAAWIPAIWIIKVATGVIILAFMYRLWKGIIVGLGSPFFSAFYLFLYLCALEIAPLVVLLKLVKGQ